MKRASMLFVALAAVVSSCTTEMNRQDLEAYLAMPENGLVQKQDVGDLTIEILYRPASVLAVDTDTGTESRYFILSLSRQGAEALDPTRGFSAFSSLLQTLAFRPEEYMMLTTSAGDTLAPSNSILERTYGMGASNRILVAFPPLPGKAKADLVFHLNEFGLHSGKLQFSFAQQDILNIPILKLSSADSK